jgi:PKD repeat protein
VGSLNASANYAQGMDFDEETGILYWAAYTSQGELRVIDINTGASTVIGSFPGGAETDAFAVPTGGAMIDVPWVWEDPVSGTVAAGGSLDVEIGFTSWYVSGTDTIHLPLGTYTATLNITNDDPVAGKQEIPVMMHIIEQPVTPTADFTVTTPVCEGEEAWFYFTGDPGVPSADQYTWWFGDGMSMTVGTPDPVMHVYSAPGTYTATLEVCITTFGLCDMAYGMVEVNAQPVAGFDHAVDGLTVTFTDTSMYATSWMWDFGDGITDTVQNPVHTYAMAGSYTVTQYVYNDCGMDMAEAVVAVGETPVAGFTHNAPVCLGEVVTFTNATTGTEPLWYMWDFGDGGTSTETNPVYLYMAAGTYTVTLDATNDYGSDQAMDWVEVWAQPMAAFTYTLNGLEVSFTNLSEGAAAYLWDFGDGMGTSTETNPVYTYADAGTYTVTLNITGPCGVDTVMMPITVETPMSYLYLPVIIKTAAP